jgi:hypothetical protein
MKRNYNIMKTPRFSSEPILHFLLQNKIATLSQLLDVLGSSVPITVFRKLDQLHYRSSYSHRGRFYTLDRIAQFDPHGLWSHDSVWFSRYGTLVATAEALVNRSPSGLFVAELEELLHVSAQDALLQLVQQRRLSRQLFSGLYLYSSADPATQKAQCAARQARAVPSAISRSVAALPEVSGELKAGIVLFYSLLDERQRRLYAGLEALKLGNDRRIAELLGLDPHTVAKGRRELLTQEVERERVRRAGGGRPPTEKKRRT